MVGWFDDRLIVLFDFFELVWPTADSNSPCSPRPSQYAGAWHSSILLMNFNVGCEEPCENKIKMNGVCVILNCFHRFC